MSFFDDNDEDWYYDPQDEFQQQVLKNADAHDDHPLVYLVQKQGAALNCLEEFVSQDPHITERERVAIKSDVQEARESINRALQLTPPETIEEES